MVDEEILMHYYEEIANKLDEMSPVEWTKIAMLAIDSGISRSAFFYFYTTDGMAHYGSAIPD